MKKPITKLYYLLLIACATTFGCTKNSDTPAPVVVPATSQWTFTGKTYAVKNGTYNDSFNTLMASDDASVAGGGNYVSVLFGSIVKPTKSSTLTVVDISTAGDPSNCKIQVGNIYDTYYIAGHISTGKPGDKVVLTVSPTGMLTASFSNITVTTGPTGTDTLKVSGTIVQNY